MYESDPRLVAAVCTTLALLVGVATPAVAADAAAAEETECVAEVEPNDVRDDGAVIAGEGCISGTLVEVGDVDVFRWQVEAADIGTSWTLELDGVAGTTTTLVLEDVAEPGVEVVRLEAVAGQELADAGLAVDAAAYDLIVSRAEADPEVEIADAADYAVRLGRAVALEASETPAAEPTTGSIRVVAGAGEAPVFGAGVAMELLLDTSGSMLADLGQSTKLKVAERTLIDIVDELPDGTPVALRTFKAKPRSCATVLRVPLEPLRRKAMKQTIRDLPARKGTRTPIAKALDRVPGDLEGHEGHAVVVLVTDGKEDCGGDPAAAIVRLSDAGFTTTVHLIGYALPDDEALRTDLGEWAALGGGRFIEAADRGGLTAALEIALTAPYLVFDEEGVLVAQGLAGDDGVEVKAGVYGVEVLTDPPSEFVGLEVEAGMEVELPLGMSADPAE